MKNNLKSYRIIGILIILAFPLLAGCSPFTRQKSGVNIKPKPHVFKQNERTAQGGNDEASQSVMVHEDLVNKEIPADPQLAENPGSLYYEPEFGANNEDFLWDEWSVVADADVKQLGYVPQAPATAVRPAPVVQSPVSSKPVAIPADNSGFGLDRELAEARAVKDKAFEHYTRIATKGGGDIQSALGEYRKAKARVDELESMKKSGKTR